MKLAYGMRLKIIGSVVVTLAGLFFFSCHDPTPGDVPASQKDYTWTVDTLVYDGPSPAPDQVNVLCIWGSSAHDVWAVGTSDDVLGELWHYDGKRWRVVTNWPYNGIDAGGSYLNDVYAVTGFDSANVFLFGFHAYDTTGTDIVLKWNGHVWSELPWISGIRPRGGLGWGVKQNSDKLWGVSSTGQIVKYVSGLLSVDTVIPNYRLGIYQVAALDNGTVYVNAYKDSLDGDTLRGSVTNLYMGDINGQWSLIERKFVSGSYGDGSGLGRGVFSIGDRLFTANRGLWEKTSASWEEVLALVPFGGSCVASDSDWWTYFEHQMWHFDGKGWKAITIPFLSQYAAFFLYGEGWSDGHEVFVSLTENGRESYILHGKVKGS